MIVPTTISQAPRKIATATIPGPGHTMIATPTAIDSNPVTTLARRERASMPKVRAIEIPSKMNSAPMKVARLRTLQSIVKMRNPATISSRPLISRSGQFWATRSAPSRESFWAKSGGAVPGATNMSVLQVCDVNR